MCQILIAFLPLLFNVAYGDSAESLFEKIASKDVLAKYTSLLFDNGCRPVLISWDKECINPALIARKPSQIRANGFYAKMKVPLWIGSLIAFINSLGEISQKSK